MKCPHCHNRVLQKSETSTRLRTDGPITFDATGQAHARCYWCKADIELPIALQDREALPRQGEERFFVTTTRRS
jgi:hypothetical protein